MNQIRNETKIIKWIILLPIIGVLLTALVLTEIFISSQKESYNTEINNIQAIHTSNLKNKIQERIEHISTLLTNNYKYQINESKGNIEDIMIIGQTFLENIYEKNRHLSKKELYRKIDEKMKSIRFSTNGNGYFFIYESKSGQFVSLPSKPSLVGTSLKDFPTINDINLYEHFKKILAQKSQGFSHWYWNKPNQEEKIKKIGSVKEFKPLNLVFGTAIYDIDIQTKITTNAENFLKSLQYKDNSYIFAMDSKGTAIIHKKESIIGVDINNLSSKIQKNVKDIIKQALNSDGTFLEYDQSKNLFKEFKQSRKISYVKYIPELNWIIGTGLYTNDLNNEIILKKKRQKKKLEENIQTTLWVSLLVTLIILFFLVIISNKIKHIIHSYSSKLDENNKKLHNLNVNLEQKVAIQVEKNREKDKILYQQSKMASMGEMLGNIAHQWRQPLSAISTAASGILIQKQFNQLTDKHMDYSLSSIVRNTQLLSQTIDDFKDFYKKDKKKNNFVIEDLIQKVLTLIDANLKNKDIEIIKNIEVITICTYENELVQSILNIINNARDALVELPNEKRKCIFINIYKQNAELIIEIKDSAGGINEDVIHKVFEPYFTTKHKAQGTGIGLYMTHEIITEHLLGSIDVINTSYSYKNSEYEGALFTIRLPLDNEN